MTRYKMIVSATLAGVSMVAAAGAAQADDHFTFFGNEFQPREQRLALAQAYVTQSMVPGRSMARAERAARRAGAYCRRPGADGVVTCTESSMRRHTGEGMDDLTYTIRLTPAADGTLATASVMRDKAGL